MPQSQNGICSPCIDQQKGLEGQEKDKQEVFQAGVRTDGGRIGDRQSGNGRQDWDLWLLEPFLCLAEAKH